MFCIKSFVWPQKSNDDFGWKAGERGNCPCVCELAPAPLDLGAHQKGGRKGTSAFLQTGQGRYSYQSQINLLLVKRMLPQALPCLHLLVCLEREIPEAGNWCNECLWFPLQRIGACVCAGQSNSFACHNRISHCCKKDFMILAPRIRGNCFHISQTNKK